MAAKARVTLAKTAGFCFGVDRAVRMTYMLVESGKRVATLGPLIHNPQVVDDLRKKGVRTAFTKDITNTADGKEAFLRLAIDPEGGCNQAQSFVSCPFGGCYMQLAREAIWPCQVAAHHGSFARRFGYDMHDVPDDSLPLASIASANDIETFRRRSHPMCRYCNNDALTVVPWGRSKLSADEWLSSR